MNMPPPVNMGNANQAHLRDQWQNPIQGAPQRVNVNHNNAGLGAQDFNNQPVNGERLFMNQRQ